MPSLINTLNAFNEYLDEQGTNAKLKQDLSEYHVDRDEFLRDFYVIKLNNEKRLSLNEQIKKTLDALKVPIEQQGRYLNQPITVYDMLVELSETKELKNSNTLNDFIRLLDEQKNTRWKNTLLLSALFSTLLLSPVFIYGFTITQQLLSACLFIGAAGIVKAVAVAIHTAFEARVNHELSYLELLRENAFAVSYSFFSILAWSLMMAAVVATPVYSGLFVLAEVTVVAKELWSLAFMPKPDNDHEATRHQRARELVDYEKRKKAIVVNIVAAVVLLVILAVWCFPPSGILLTGGGLLLAAGCLLAMGVVHLSKRYAQSKIDAAMSESLRQAFQAIEVCPGIESAPRSVTVKPSNSLDEKPNVAVGPVQSLKDRPGTWMCFSLFGTRKNKPPVVADELKMGINSTAQRSH